MNINETKKKLKQLDLRPKSRLGQTFLVDETVIQDQINFAAITKRDTVLEIGPGLGVLTNKLAERASKVIAIEFDKKLYSHLETVVVENVEVIYGDALALDFPKFNKIVSNIPYQISSPLIFKLIKYQFDLAIIMFQVEFAKRLIGQLNTKNYSRLTVMSSYYYDIDFLRTVSRSSFMPVPKVDSAIIKIMPKKARDIAINEPLFSEIVRIVFNERRKMMKNSILNQFPKIEQFFRIGLLHNKFTKVNLTKSNLKDILSELPEMTRRPEQLSLEEFIQMSNELHIALDDLLQ